MSMLLSEVPVAAGTAINLSHLDVSATALKNYRTVAARMIECFGDVDVTTVTRDQYAAWHDWLATRPCRPVTVNTYRRAGRAIWNRLRARGVDVCDITGITKFIDPGLPPGKATPTDWLTRALQITNPRDTAMMIYMVEAGFRRQTVPRLTVADTMIWQGPDGRFRVASKIPQEKTSAPRIIMAGHRAAVAVMNWQNIREYPDSPWLFYALDDGAQMSADTVSSAFARIRRAANVPEYVSFHAHALRHAFAQEQLQEHDAKMVSQWMGITVETLLNVYAVRSQKQLVEARFGDSEAPPELFR